MSLTFVDLLMVLLVCGLANFMTIIIYLSYIKRDLDNGRWDEVGRGFEEWLIETMRKSSQ